MGRLSAGDWQNRCRIASVCPDADVIPKVENAGQYLIENGNELQILHNGLKVLKNGYYNGLLSQLIWAMKGVHEPQEEYCFYEVLKHIPDNAVMIELGSYWAFYSMWFCKNVPDAVCHCIELDLPSLELGIQHFALNGLRAIFTNAGIGKPNLKPWHTEVVGEYVRTLPNGQIFWKRTHPTPGFHRNIPLITIDSYLADNMIPFVHLLHSDIQGEEVLMLEGAEHALSNQKLGFIFISTHGDEVHAKCSEALRRHKYKIIAEHSVEDSFSGDGLIVAKSASMVGPDHLPISMRTKISPI